MSSSISWIILHHVLIFFFTEKKLGNLFIGVYILVEVSICIIRDNKQILIKITEFSLVSNNKYETARRNSSICKTSILLLIL